MKARLLQKALGTTRVVADYGDKVGVASTLCHDLIHFKKDSLRVVYTLACHWEDPRPRDQELVAIYDKLTKLCQSGEINKYLDGDDEVQNGVAVFWDEDGEIRESVTEAVEFGNVTREGFRIYTNTHFKTREEAIRNGIGSAKACLSASLERIAEIESDLLKAKKRAEKYRNELEKYERMAPTPNAKGGT